MFGSIEKKTSSNTNCLKKKVHIFFFDQSKYQRVSLIARISISIFLLIVIRFHQSSFWAFQYYFIVFSRSWYCFQSLTFILLYHWPLYYYIILLYHITTSLTFILLYHWPLYYYIILLYHWPLYYYIIDLYITISYCYIIDLE
jgi:hypothetical protein